MEIILGDFSQSAGKFTECQGLKKGQDKDYISFFASRRSSAVELLNRNQRVGGSNPSAGSSFWVFLVPCKIL